MGADAIDIAFGPIIAFVVVILVGFVVLLAVALLVLRWASQSGRSVDEFEARAGPVSVRVVMSTSTTRMHEPSERQDEAKAPSTRRSKSRRRSRAV